MYSKYEKPRAVLISFLLNNCLTDGEGNLGDEDSGGEGGLDEDD